MSVSLRLDSSEGKDELHRISRSIQSCKRILIVSGAGISTSSGVPDFRSSEGLYKTVGKDLFHADILRSPKTLSLWYQSVSRMKHLMDQAFPSPTHWFIHFLDLRRKLLRHYSQNIDGVEEMAGMSEIDPRAFRRECGGVVLLHGSIKRLRCEACGFKTPWTSRAKDDLGKGVSTPCANCHQNERRGKQGGMVLRERTIGYLRPDITLYGETQHNGEDIAQIINYDIFRKPDMLLVMGTSLAIDSLKTAVRSFANAVHAEGGISVLINKGEVGSRETWGKVFDFFIKCEVDSWVSVLVEHWMESNPKDWGERKHASKFASRGYSVLTEPEVFWERLD